MFGIKEIRNAVGLDIWSDTTTLYITISEETDSRFKERGKGILHIDPLDFARQLTTMEVFHVSDKIERLHYLAKFGPFFSDTLIDTYGGIFVRPQVFKPCALPRKMRM